MEDIQFDTNISAKFVEFKQLHKVLNLQEKTTAEIFGGGESHSRRRGRPAKTMTGASALVGVEAQNALARRTNLCQKNLTKQDVVSSGAGGNFLPSGQLQSDLSSLSLPAHKQTLKRWRVNFETVHGRGMHVFALPPLPPRLRTHS